MRLTCVLCEKPIEIGEPLLANQSGELAHQSCVESRSEIRVQLPSATASSSKVSMENLPAGAVILPPEPFLSPPTPKVCVVCARPCIGACPCGALVCQAYGYERSCGLIHEATCSLAKESRAPSPKSSGWQLPGGQGAKLDVSAWSGNGRNGAHGKKKGRR